jgi:hypothetical protein
MPSKTVSSPMPSPRSAVAVSPTRSGGALMKGPRSTGGPRRSSALRRDALRRRQLS